MTSSNIEKNEKLIIVSNRVPYNFTKTSSGFSYKRSIGGLVTAMDPIMLSNGGTWIGWSGQYRKVKLLEDKIRMESRQANNYEIRFVNLSEEEISLFYHGFSNRTLWPLLHGFIFQSYFNHEYWKSYQSANKKYAKSVLEETNSDEIIWVHDYHLALVPNILRVKKPDARILFFMHIPFPNSDTFRVLPWDKEILHGMLGSNLIGFQTKNDVFNFMSCCKKILNLEIDVEKNEIEYDGRIISVNDFPISIDFNHFSNIAKSASTLTFVKNIRRATKNKKIILSVERLDYTKGIKERLIAIERFFEKYPEHRKNVFFIQVCVPSRAKVQEYITFKNEIDKLIGKINGRFSEELWSPVIYIYKALSQEKLSAYYKASDICFVTPLRDGMNLIAKEYVSCKGDSDGVLILSEFAGCADELTGYSVMVNPYDTESTADSINIALQMNAKEKKDNILQLQKIVKENDVYKWCNNFLNYPYHA